MGFLAFDSFLLCSLIFCIFAILSLGKKVGCFTFIVFLMACGCYCSLSLPHDDVGWSVDLYVWHFLVILTYLSYVLSSYYWYQEAFNNAEIMVYI